MAVYDKKDCVNEKRRFLHLSFGNSCVLFLVGMMYKRLKNFINKKRVFACIMAVYDKKDCVNEKTQVFTPEFWQFVCLIFGRDDV